MRGSGWNLRGILSFLLIIVPAGCALPRPVAVELQDFVSKKDVLVASLVKQAQTDYARGRYLDCEGWLRKALYLAPETTQVSLNLARVLAKNGQLQESQFIFDKILQRKAKDVSVHTFVGETLYEAGQFQRGEMFFDRALLLAPVLNAQVDPLVVREIESAERSKSVAAFRRSDIESALCSAHEIFARMPNPDNLVRLARLEIAFGRFVQAEKRISSFLLSSPGSNDARIFLVRALSYLGQGIEEKAIEDLVAAQKREESIGDYSLELMLLGEAYIPPPPLDEGQDPMEEEESQVVQELSVAQRLFIPVAVLDLMDRKAAEKKLLFGDQET